MRRRTVLIVEDNDDLRSLFSDMLGTSGFAVREAADGMAALRIIAAAPPDLVVLDLALPRVSGYDVLFELKEHAHTRNVPVVIVTGSNDAFEDLNPDCVLRKPVEPAELVRQIERCLAER